MSFLRPRARRAASTLRPAPGLHALAEAVLLGAMALLGLIRLLCHWGLGSFGQAVGTISVGPACRCGCERCVPRRGRPLVAVPVRPCAPVTGRIIREASQVSSEEGSICRHIEHPLKPAFSRPGSPTVDDLPAASTSASPASSRRTAHSKWSAEAGPSAASSTSATRLAGADPRRGSTRTYPDPSCAGRPPGGRPWSTSGHRVGWPGLRSEVLVLGAHRRRTARVPPLGLSTRRRLPPASALG